MNIKVAAFTVSEKYINTQRKLQEKDKPTDKDASKVTITKQPVIFFVTS